jgi:long-chain acyl-CoA synthetase
MLHHSCYDGAIAAHFKRFPELGDQDIIMNFLPFTHVFERAWSYWCLAMGCTLCVNLRPQDIQTTIKEVRPTAMCSVPRFWEKVYSGVYELINRSSGIKKALMLDAIKVGRQHNVEYKMKGLTPPTWLSLRYRLYDRTVYSLLRKTVGIDRGRFFPTAGAAIPPAVQEFVLSVGINMVAGYGLTESTATVSCEGSVEHCIGSVGKLMPHCQVRIDPETNEIQLRGVGITRGYYKKDAVTQEAFTADGWFHTGDAGYIKDDYLFLTDRIKDLFKTSNGKYIAPQAIESKLVVDRYIDQISIVADQRKFVSALIIPEYKLVEEYAAQHAIAYADRADLLQKPEIIALFKERIDTLQQEFAHYEQIKRFTLLPEPFSMAKGELTNTLKIKRAVLYKNYKDVIEKMYAE